jgi:hypothetical protein
MDRTIQTSSTTRPVTRAKRRIREKSTRPLGHGPLLILDPLGFALFGRRIGDEVRLASDTGERRVLLEAIPYQPEAAGDYHL